MGETERKTIEQRRAERKIAKRKKTKREVLKTKLTYLSIFGLVFLACSVLLCIALCRSPEYSDENTKEVSGIVSNIRTEMVSTGYKSDRDPHVFITLDNGEEFHIAYSIIIRDMKQDYDEFCKGIQNSKVIIHLNKYNSLIVSLVGEQGREFLSYEVSNRASRGIRIGVIIVYFIVLIGSGLFIWLNYSIKYGRRSYYKA